MKNREGGIKGFTLIELLVVVLIIGILASIALPQYQKAVFKSRVTEAFTNLKTMKNALVVCELANGRVVNGWDDTCSRAENLDIQIGEFKDAGYSFQTDKFFYQVDRGMMSDNNVAAHASMFPGHLDICICIHDDGHFSTPSADGRSGCHPDYPNFNVARALNIEENDGCMCC